MAAQCRHATGTRLVPWLPLIAMAFDVEIPPTAEIEMLAESNRRAKLHESVVRFIEMMMPEPALIEIENAHHIDEASAELLSLPTPATSRPGRGCSPSRVVVPGALSRWSKRLR